MKNISWIFCLFFLSATTMIAQSDKINFGIKAGLNYGDNGKIEIQDFQNARQNITKENGDARTGFHVGTFLRLNITDNIFLRPELQYTQTGTEYRLREDKRSYNLKKLDAPLLIGYKFLGPLYLTGGPSLQYILNNDLEDVKIDDVKNSFTVGLQIGLGVQIGALNADIRYERGLSDNQARALENGVTDIRVDARANQFIVSLGFDL